MDLANRISLVMEGRVRTRRKRWTIVQPVNPMEFYRLLHEKFRGKPRCEQYPGRTQSSTDLMKYYAVLDPPPPHPGLGQRFVRYLGRLKPWQSPRPTLNEKKQTEQNLAQVRAMKKAKQEKTVKMKKKPVTKTANEVNDEDEIGYDKILLMTRILDLEQEIQVCKEQNEQVSNLRENMEHQNSELKKSKRVFDLYRAKTYDILKEKKESIRREREHVRKVALELGKALDRKNAEDQTEEIHKLRKKVKDLEKELSRRTKLWSMTATSLKATIEKLMKEKEELQKRLGNVKDEEPRPGPSSKCRKR